MTLNLFDYMRELEDILFEVVGLGEDFEGFSFSRIFVDMGQFFVQKDYRGVFNELLGSYKIPQYKPKNLMLLLEHADHILSQSPYKTDWNFDREDFVWVPNLGERAEFLWQQMVSLKDSPQQLLPFLMLIWCFLGGSHAENPKDNIFQVREIISTALEPVTLSAFVYALELQRNRQIPQTRKSFHLSLALDGAPHYLLENELVEVIEGRLHIARGGGGKKAITAAGQVAQTLERQDLYPRVTNAAVQPATAHATATPAKTSTWAAPTKKRARKRRNTHKRQTPRKRG